MTDTPLDIALPGRGPHPAGGHRGRRDGCGCPQGIVRCAHYDGRVVWLGQSGCSEHYDGYCGLLHWEVLGPAVPEQCHCPNDHCVMPFAGGAFGTDSLPDAEAEYERRCELLRRAP